MQTARSAFGCVVVNNCIYVVGGCKDQINLFDVERFDVSTGQWSKSTNLSSRRSSLACVAWNNCIYAIGGYNGEEFIRKIEKLDLNVQSSQWNQIKQLRHPHGISGHGAVISIERFI
jgi:N-acetylneuraminic acid mutarotase